MTPKELNKKAGKRLRQAREAAGFKTLDALADAAGTDAEDKAFTGSRIHNYESGYRGMKTHIVKQLAGVLGVSAAWLACLDDDLTASTETEKALLQNYRAADERGKKAISRIAEAECPDYLGLERNNKAG